MIKLKENKTVGKHFDTDCWVYSGIKDAYGNPCYVVVNYRAIRESYDAILSSR